MTPTFDLQKAVDFIQSNGSVLEKARLAYLLHGEPPPEKVYRPLLDLQNQDGGFPSRPRPGSASSVDSSLTALWQLRELGMFQSTAASRALDFLLTMQSADGGWDENPSLPPYDLPPWIQPGQMPTRMYLSSYAAYWLATGGFTTLPAFRRGAAFLASQQDAQGKIPGYLHNSWIGGCALLLAGGEFTKPGERTLQFLAATPFSEWDDSQVSWALDFFGSASLPASNPLIAAALSELARRQSADGSWASEDGPQYAASATMSALKAFHHFGLLNTTME